MFECVWLGVAPRTHAQNMITILGLLVKYIYLVGGSICPFNGARESSIGY